MKRGVTPVNKGLFEVSFVRFFMPFCELCLEQNKNEMTAILNNKVMSKKQVKKSYSAPRCIIIQVNETTYLMDASMPGQHNPAQPGGTSGDAKKAFDWMNEDEEETPSWKD